MHVTVGRCSLQLRYPPSCIVCLSQGSFAPRPGWLRFHGTGFPLCRSLPLRSRLLFGRTPRFGELLGGRCGLRLRKLRSNPRFGRCAGTVWHTTSALGARCGAVWDANSMRSTVWHTKRVLGARCGAVWDANGMLGTRAWRLAARTLAALLPQRWRRVQLRRAPGRSVARGASGGPSRRAWRSAGRRWRQLRRLAACGHTWCGTTRRAFRRWGQLRRLAPRAEAPGSHARFSRDPRRRHELGRRRQRRR